jgi:hypothetical protein
MVSKLALAVAFVVAFGLAGPATCMAQLRSMEKSPEDMQTGLALVGDQREDLFVPVEYASLSPAIRAQTENYLAMYLTPEAQPQRDPAFQTRTYSAASPGQSDLVEFRWAFNGMALRAVQSLNALKVEIPLGGRTRVDEVKALVNSVVKLKGTDLDGRDYDARLRWPNAVADGARFSSNPDANLFHMNAWHERVDALVEGGRLSVLIYKKIPQLMGYQDGSQWFEKYPPPPKKPTQ